MPAPASSQHCTLVSTEAAGGRRPPARTGRRPQVSRPASRNTELRELGLTPCVPFIQGVWALLLLSGPQFPHMHTVCSPPRGSLTLGWRERARPWTRESGSGQRGRTPAGSLACSSSVPPPPLQTFHSLTGTHTWPRPCLTLPSSPPGGSPALLSPALPAGTPASCSLASRAYGSVTQFPRARGPFGATGSSER